MDRRGLLYIWASAIAAMFIVYITWSYAIQILGIVDYYINQIWEILGIPTNSTFRQLYITDVSILREFFGYLGFALFISLIIYIIVNSARREPNEVEMAY
ncbi:hypothetical protein DRN87_02180 [Candidatus Geothermarchaeota archaeon]|nr:MAG: hypothetical protein DRN87_02180 [Candidatus Geothermarchaeota archaeon]